MLDGRNIHLDAGRAGQTYPLCVCACVRVCVYGGAAFWVLKGIGRCGMHCTVHCTVLYCTVLYCTVLLECYVI